jgi:hypothetical protein
MTWSVLTSKFLSSIIQPMDEEQIIPASYDGSQKPSGSNTGLLIIVFILLLILAAGGAFLFGANQKGGQEETLVTPTPTEEATPTEVLGESTSLTPTVTATPTSNFKVTSLAAAVAVPSSSCPTTTSPITLVFTATITTNEAGTVKYQWERSDGSTPIQGTLNFTEAGTKTVNNSWKFFGAYDGSAKLTVTSPNVIKSNDANFKLSCILMKMPTVEYHLLPTTSP